MARCYDIGSDRSAIQMQNEDIEKLVRKERGGAADVTMCERGRRMNRRLQAARAPLRFTGRSLSHSAPESQESLTNSNRDFEDRAHSEFGIYSRKYAFASNAITVAR